MKRRTRSAMVLTLVTLLVALLPPVAGGDTIDLGGLDLRETFARALTPPGVTFECSPGDFPPPDDDFCLRDESLFVPSDLTLHCSGRRCTLQLDLCLDYTLSGAGAIGVVFFRVDGVPPAPGPEAPVATLRSDGLDPNHNRACVTQFAAGLVGGPHTVVAGAGVDNNFSGQTVSIHVRSATLVVRVYR